MGRSVSSLSEPRMFTDKSVKYVRLNAVWIISGEGKSPKVFYLATVFKPNKTTIGVYDHPDFKNAAYGAGHIFGETIELNRIGWFESLKVEQQNFRNGLFEVTDSKIIDEMRKLAGTHAL